MAGDGQFDGLHPQDTAHHQPLVVILAAASAGIVVDRYQPLPLGTWCLLAAASLLCWFPLYTRQRNLAAALTLLIALAAAAAAWHHLCWNLFSVDQLGRYARPVPRPVCVRGRTTEVAKQIPAPQHDPLRTIPANQRSRVVLQINAIRDGTSWRKAAGLATLLVEGHLLGTRPGDQLEVYGRLTRPPPANNPGEFDFARYRRTRRQLCLVRASHPDCVVTLSRSSRWNPGTWLARIRAAGSRILWSYLDHDRAGLAAAVLLGERERLEHDRTEAFVETGTIHLLAISGLHVGILVSVLTLALRGGWVSRPLGLLLIPALTLFYALLTDARPPVMRAALLIGISCLALYHGRRPLGFNTLAAAALVVLLWNPAQLFRVGGQLSFLAVGTLICFGPVWHRWQQEDALLWLIRSTRPAPVRLAHAAGRWIWRLTLAGLAVWLVALPLVMHHFHLCSPVGVLLTPLLYLPVAIALFSGLGVLVFGWLLPPLAVVFGHACDFSLGTLEGAVLVARQLPGAYTWVSGPPVWWLIVFYTLLALWALAPPLRPPNRWSLAIIAGWTTVLVVAGAVVPFPTQDHRGLRCTFTAVGHGCSVLVELPDGKVLLYDAGRMGSPQSATRAISSLLWSRGHTHIDALVISHADADHFNSVPELLQRFSMGVVYVSPAMRQDRSTSVRVLFQRLAAAGVPVARLQKGDRLTGGGAVIDVLHPAGTGFQTATAGSVDNANSIVLAVRYQDRRILLPGDLEYAGLEAVTASGALDCDVLLAPHHGSPHSDPARMAAWCRPEWTIVSSGFAPLHPKLVDAYGPPNRQLLQTSRCGAIFVTVRDGNLDVHTMHHPASGQPASNPARPSRF